MRNLFCKKKDFFHKSNCSVAFIHFLKEIIEICEIMINKFKNIQMCITSNILSKT